MGNSNYVINRLILFKISIILSCIFFNACTKNYELKKPDDTSPKATVIEWTKQYGVDLDRASELTTLEFREGKPRRFGQQIYGRP